MMQYSIQFIQFLLVAFSFTVSSCGNKTTTAKKERAASGEQQKMSGSNPTNLPKQIKPVTAVFEFVSYNDNGDYMLLNAKKENQLYGFINDNNDDRSLLRGDVCEIQWKEDTIYIAGDGERPELADWVISIRKIKDGKSSAFRKTYKKELLYHYRSDETDYSESYLDELYLLVEYYIANSTNTLIRSAVENREQLEYSIEEQVKNNRSYTVFGIGSTSEHSFHPVQWLYYDNEKDLLYEYDLPADKLVKFHY
ncbi:hypothetical protein [Taishania pollutisoli]|nr:hypothetical protein [Taishania pollutisoli]